MRGVPRERRAISNAPSAVGGHVQQPGRARDDARQFLGRVELQPRDDAEAVAQRVGQHAGARGRADQREGLQVELDRARGRALADHDVDLVVLQRRVEDLLDHRAQAVDLVDEEHVVALQVGQDRRQVLGLFQHRARGAAQVDAQLVGDDVAQRRLAQPRRAEQQHMVQRLGALLGRADEDLQLLARLGLAHVVGQALRAQRALDGLFVGRRGRGAEHAARRFEAVGLDGHGAIIGTSDQRRAGDTGHCVRGSLLKAAVSMHDSPIARCLDALLLAAVRPWRSGADHRQGPLGARHRGRPEGHRHVRADHLRQRRQAGVGRVAGGRRGRDPRDGDGRQRDEDARRARRSSCPPARRWS